MAGLVVEIQLTISIVDCFFPGDLTLLFCRHFFKVFSVFLGKLLELLHAFFLGGRVHAVILRREGDPQVLVVGRLGSLVVEEASQ